MRQLPLTLLACIAVANLAAQPYVDPLNIRFTRSMGNNNQKSTSFSHLYIGSDLPVKLNHGIVLVISPFYERWNIDSGANKNYVPVVSSAGLVVAAIVPLQKDRWSLTAGFIPRFNSEGLTQNNSFQAGGLLLATYQQHQNLRYKFGVYVNSEFFGMFIMPLGGIDWRINRRSNFFGVLPGKLTYEYQLSRHFYTGANFRALTNSYRLSNGNYLRMNDNQLSGYLDWYVTSHIVLTAEGGYGILRKLRTGQGRNKIYVTEPAWEDGLFFKLCASYRVRL